MIQIWIANLSLFLKERERYFYSNLLFCQRLIEAIEAIKNVYRGRLNFIWKNNDAKKRDAKEMFVC